MGHHTYMREAMPAHMRATCPLCCRPIQVVSDGTMVRHGWKESGRQVGSIGLGFQWDECPATRSRPLEQTDEDGLVHLETIRRAIEVWQRVVDSHVTGLDSYIHEVHYSPRAVGADQKKGAWEASGLAMAGEPERREEKGRFGSTHEVMVLRYVVPRGFPGVIIDSYSKRASGSYESLRESAHAVSSMKLQALQTAEQTLVTAIEHHRANEPKRVVEEGRVSVVHAAWPRTGRAVCGARGYSSVTTNDRSKVTCTRCLKNAYVIATMKEGA